MRRLQLERNRLSGRVPDTFRCALWAPFGPPSIHAHGGTLAHGGGGSSLCPATLLHATCFPVDRQVPFGPCPASRGPKSTQARPPPTAGPPSALPTAPTPERHFNASITQLLLGHNDLEGDLEMLGHSHLMIVSVDHNPKLCGMVGWEAAAARPARGCWCSRARMDGVGRRTLGRGRIGACMQPMLGYSHVMIVSVEHNSKLCSMVGRAMAATQRARGRGCARADAACSLLVGVGVGAWPHACGRAHAGAPRRPFACRHQSPRTAGELIARPPAPTHPPATRSPPLCATPTATTPPALASASRAPHDPPPPLLPLPSPRPGLRARAARARGAAGPRGRKRPCTRTAVTRRVRLLCASREAPLACAAHVAPARVRALPRLHGLHNCVLALLWAVRSAPAGAAGGETCMGTACSRMHAPPPHARARLRCARTDGPAQPNAPPSSRSDCLAPVPP